MTRATSNESRLPRLLALVPYLQARPGIRVDEAAADFGVTEAQLRRDLQLLWMCGLPGHGPGDLIDLSFIQEGSQHPTPSLDQDIRHAPTSELLEQGRDRDDRRSGCDEHLAAEIAERIDTFARSL